MLENLEILLTRFLIKRLRKGYGADCPDYEKTCASCQAKRTIEFLEKHIELLKNY
ncbi:MAG: hypothetical protein NT041_02280 [Candidatus Vogelbacteria bacterium]|nr:hypothetical protein [Candidatus Vogelbacteria bacterium]